MISYLSENNYFEVRPHTFFVLTLWMVNLPSQEMSLGPSARKDVGLIGLTSGHSYVLTIRPTL